MKLLCISGECLLNIIELYIYIVFYFTILMMMYFQLLQSFMVKEDWNLRTLALAIQLDSKGNVT